MKRNADFKCRWCPKTSETAQGIAAHEYRSHPKEWRASKRKGGRKSVRVIREPAVEVEDEPEQVVVVSELPEEEQVSVREETETHTATVGEFNAAAEVETIIHRIDERLAECEQKIKELEMYERLRTQLIAEREALQKAVSEIRPRREVQPTIPHPSSRREELVGSAS